MEWFRKLVKGPAGKFLLMLFIVPFIYMAFSSYVTAPGSASAAAVVNGDEISEAAVDNRVNQLKERIIRQQGDNFNPDLIDEDLLKKQELDNLIQQRLVLQAAADAGITIPDADIAEFIQSLPVFQQDGKFSKDLYLTALMQQGIQPKQFPQMIAEEMMVTQHGASIANSAFATDAEINLAEHLSNQSRDIYYATFKRDDFLQGIELEEEQVQQWYEEHQSSFRTPEKFRLAYVEFAPEDFLSEEGPSAEDIKAAYDHELAMAAEKEQWDISHILVEVNDDRSWEQADALAVEIAGKIEAGQDFAALASEFSDDFSTATGGGELGIFEKGSIEQTLPEQFVDVLSGLAAGEVSGPVETDQGIHILRLNEKILPDVPAFEDRKEELAEIIRQEDAFRLYEDMLTAIVEEQYMQPDNLEAIAAGAGIEMAETAALPQRELPGLLATPDVARKLKTTEILDEHLVSEIITVGDRSVVFQLEQYIAPEVRPLAEVRDEVESRIRQEIAAERLSQKVEEILAQARAGKNLDELLRNEQKNVQVFSAVQRSSEDVAPEIVRKVFAMPRPAEAGESVASIQLLNGDMALTTVTGVSEPALSKRKAPRQAVQAFAQRNGTLTMASFVAYLEESGEITRRF